MSVPPRRLRRLIGMAVATAVLSAGAVTLDVQPAAAAYPVPPTPAGLTAAIEALQPYVGQSSCDPVAKPGVAAFRNLLLKTYTDTGSFGIVRDCGVGGQSEHKEGRAFDWKVSAYNTRQKGEADALMAWLLKTDQHGNTAAMARRFGIMYMIWNKRIWKAYDPQWRSYSGASPHTDHVHFSFGWSGAKKVTSYWDGTVAPLDFGPRRSPRVYPVRVLSNVPLRRTYANTSLRYGSGGAAVTYLQKRLGVPADGDYGSTTATAVAHFQVDQRLEPTQRWGLREWQALLPLPQSPIGAMDPPAFILGNLLVNGWALDLDTTAPVLVTARVDGGEPQTLTADLMHDGVRRDYPEWGADHGFALVLPVADGPHTVCMTVANAAGTPGGTTSLGCRDVTAQHSPIGALDSATPALGTVTVRGWALDPDSADPVQAALTINGVPSPVRVRSTNRPDIAARYPGMSDQQGLEADLTLTEGTHHVCLVVTNASGTPGQDATVGCRSVTAHHSPTGSLDSVRRVPGGVRVTGWALDPDVTEAQPVELLSNGVPVATLGASERRPALLASWPRHTDDYAFTAVLDLAPGSHKLCARVANALDTPGFSRTLSPCRTVTVNHDAAGSLSHIRAYPATGRVVIAGDAYDADTYAATAVVVVSDGRIVKKVTADRSSATSARRWPGYGGEHGFATSVTLSPGRHTVCTHALNAGGSSGVSKFLGCRVVTVSKAVGQVTSWRVSGRTVTARGWAIDPDRKTATKATILVDGRAVKGVLASRSRADVLRKMPGYGSAHGFVISATLTRGRHTVCITSANLAGTPGSSTGLACRSVRVA